MDEQLQAEIKRLKGEYLTLWDKCRTMRDRNVGLQKSVDELQRTTDPFVPDWKHAPKYALYHTVNRDGTGTWWRTSGIILMTDAWTLWRDRRDDERDLVRPDTATYDLTGLDWRNSLRARPEVQP
jgi:hypothetical protein